MRRSDDERVYALKRLKNPKRAARFAREVQTMRDLRAADLPVPPIVDSGEVGGRPYFVMPWYVQGSLEERVVGRTYVGDHTAALALLVSLAEILLRVHEVGIAHRDLKPANVLLDSDQPVLTDFGLSLSASEDDPSTRLTETAEAIGSRLYIAPENEGGFNEVVDQRPADFYAFGKVAWAVLAGSRPPAREGQTLIENRLATLYPESDLGSLDSLLADCVQPDPRTRLTDWEPILVGLQDALARERGDVDTPGTASVVDDAIAAAKRWRSSKPAIDAARREDEAARRVTARAEFRQAVRHGASSRDEELSSISNEAPMLTLQSGDGYPISEDRTPEVLRRLGLALPDGVDLAHEDVRASLNEGSPAAMRIAVQATPRVEVQLGLFPISQDDDVWVVRSALLVETAPHLSVVSVALNADYGLWAGPLRVGRQTTLDRARELGQQLIDPGIKLFGECANRLAEGRSIVDPATWQAEGDAAIFPHSKSMPGPGAANADLPPDTRRIVEALSDPDGDVRYDALSALRDRLSPELLPTIEPFMTDGDKYMRQTALEYYAQLTGPEGTARIVEALSDPDGDVRYGALSALRDRLSPELLPTIEPFMTDGDKYMRQTALEYYASLTREP